MDFDRITDRRGTGSLKWNAPSVITSYSIHYTKLYDWYALSSRIAELVIIDALWTAVAFVITSYSIHYTKLYDP